MIDAEDVARSVLHMANQPLNVNVCSLMSMATAMPYAGPG
jgi:NADP-dependent 3-hydroxy acid dehydrogenase YdfG